MVIYKCPTCGANMVFNSETQQLTCDYCETSVPIEQANDLKREETSEEAQEQKVEDTEYTTDAGTADFKMYHCPSCGAEILTDEVTVATFCSFCQSPTLVEEKVEGALAPSRLIAFKQNKEQAKSAFRTWTKKGLFTPSAFSRESTLEKVTGIYVPFWLFDYNTVTDMDVNATRVRHERRGDMQYTHTDHFAVHRRVEADFLQVPTDASKQMDDAMMDKLEPFNYEDMVKFDMSYLSGFYAERYTYSSEEMRPRVETRIKSYAKESTLDTIQGYATKVPVHENYQLNKRKEEYVMLPVWMLNYRYKGKEYQFSMNGQTGRIVGDLPLSIGKIAVAFGILWIVIFLILQFVM